MIKLIKGIFRLAEGITFLFLPIVVFYWAISLINLDIVKPLTFLLGAFIDPLISPFKDYIEYSINYNSFAVNYTILIFAGMVLFAGVTLAIIGRIFEFFESISNKVSLKIKEQDVLKKKQELKMAYVKEVSKNNTLYVTLKLIKNEPKEAYLIKNDGDDFFSVGLVDSYENSLASVYKKFSGYQHSNFGGGEKIYNYIFSDINKFLEFLPFFINRVDEVNKGMIDLNIKFDYKLACHCSYSDASSDIDIDITANILNLCGNREILLSEILKSRLEIIPNLQYKLNSRGIYLIKEKQMDIFKLKLI